MNGDQQIPPIKGAKKIDVTFTMVDGGSEEDPHHRTITLIEGSNFEVGRASRSESRAARSGPQNLWLTSPVVSKKHAQLVLRCDPDPEVYLVDLPTSMHGTMVNGMAIAKGHEWLLDDEDVVQFGTAVRTSQETFNPPEFRIKIDLMPMKDDAEDHAGASFSVPMDDEAEMSDAGSASSEVSGDLRIRVESPDTGLNHDETPDEYSPPSTGGCSYRSKPDSEPWSPTRDVGESLVSLSSSFPSGQRPKSDFLYEEAVRRQTLQMKQEETTTQKSGGDQQDSAPVQNSTPPLCVHNDSPLSFRDVTSCAASYRERSKLSGRERLSIDNICDQADEEDRRSDPLRDAIRQSSALLGDVVEFPPRYASPLVLSNPPEHALFAPRNDPAAQTPAGPPLAAMDMARILDNRNPMTGLLDSFIFGRNAAVELSESSRGKRKLDETEDLNPGQDAPAASIADRIKKPLKRSKAPRENNSTNVEIKATEPVSNEDTAAGAEPRPKKRRISSFARVAGMVMPAAIIGAVVGGAAMFIGLASMAE